MVTTNCREHLGALTSASLAADDLLVDMLNRLKLPMTASMLQQRTDARRQLAHQLSVALRDLHLSARRGLGAVNKALERLQPLVEELIGAHFTSGETTHDDAKE